MLSGLLGAARLSVPDDVAALLTELGPSLGATAVTVYLVDREQYVLVPLPRQDSSCRQPLGVDSTLAGRCFRQLEFQPAEGGRQLWVPLLDGLERLGVVQLEFASADDRADDDDLNKFAALVAELLMVKDAYGDLFARVRRRKPMSLSAEIAWNLLPPLTFGTDRLVISSVVAPAYDLGGDCFDYAVDGTTARFALFDAMGHGLQAALLATVAVGAYRNARIRELDLLATVSAIDATVADTFGGEQFVTAVLAELDLATGDLHWHLAGHPAPLLLRAGRVVKTLASDVGLPLGLGQPSGTAGMQREQLEPGDRVLLFTDGVIEARDAGGEFFGVERLCDLVVRQEAAAQPAPETMRRLMHAILAHQAGSLQDDATTMLVEWQGHGEERITP